MRRTQKKRRRRKGGVLKMCKVLKGCAYKNMDLLVCSVVSSLPFIINFFYMSVTPEEGLTQDPPGLRTHGFDHDSEQEKVDERLAEAVKSALYAERSISGTEEPLNGGFTDLPHHSPFPDQEIYRQASSFVSGTLRAFARTDTALPPEVQASLVAILDLAYLIRGQQQRVIGRLRILEQSVKPERDGFTYKKPQSQWTLQYISAILHDVNGRPDPTLKGELESALIRELAGQFGDGRAEIINPESRLSYLRIPADFAKEGHLLSQLINEMGIDRWVYVESSIAPDKALVDVRICIKETI